MEELIKYIHESDIKLDLIEIGAGCPVASKLFEIAGASNTVLSSHSPYSKESQSEFLSGKFRSVSFEAVQEIIYFRDVTNSDRKKSIFATSFQLMEDGCSHGWIGLKYKNTEKYYHITIPNSFTRIQSIEEIGNIGIQIIRYKNENLDKIKSKLKFDIINDSDGNYILKDMIGINQPEILCFTDNICVRKEIFLRDVDKITLFKGSFNPWHEGHENNHSVSPDAILAISIDTFGKCEVTPEELEKRLKNLMSLNKKIIVFTKPLFEDNIKTLMEYNSNLKIDFIVGVDTLNRIANCLTPNNKNILSSVKFIVCKRPGYGLDLEKIKDLNYILPNDFKEIDISSTKIRAGIL